MSARPRIGPAGWISAARAGGVVALILIGAGVLEFLAGARMDGPWLVLIGLFVASAARAEGADALTRANVRGLRVGDVMSHQPVTAEGATLASDCSSGDAVGQQHSAYPVVDGSGNVTGLVTLDRLRRVRPSDRATTPLAQLAIPLQDVPIATPTDSLWSLMDRLAGDTGGRGLVFEDGILVGIVTLSDVARAAQSPRLEVPVQRLVP